MVQARLDTAGVKHLRGHWRQQVPAVHHRDPAGGLQPGRRLPVAHDVNMAVVGEEKLQRAQVEKQFRVAR